MNEVITRPSGYEFLWVLLCFFSHVRAVLAMEGPCEKKSRLCWEPQFVPLVLGPREQNGLQDKVPPLGGGNGFCEVHPNDFESESDVYNLYGLWKSNMAMGRFHL